MRYSHKIKTRASVKIRGEIRTESEGLLGLDVKEKLSSVKSKSWPCGVARAWSTVLSFQPGKIIFLTLSTAYLFR